MRRREQCNIEAIAKERTQNSYQIFTFPIETATRDESTTRQALADQCSCQIQFVPHICRGTDGLEKQSEDKKQAHNDSFDGIAQGKIVATCIDSVTRTNV